MDTGSKKNKPVKDIQQKDVSPELKENMDNEGSNRKILGVDDKLIGDDLAIEKAQEEVKDNDEQLGKGENNY